LKDITRNDIDSIDYNLITFSNSMMEKMKEIDDFCKNNIFNNPQVQRTDFKGDLILSKLYETLIERISLLPISEKIWIDKGLDNETIVKNYIANLTDKSALEEYDRLFLPYRE
jgi:dGTP triphosphohydrolase